MFLGFRTPRHLKPYISKYHKLLESELMSFRWPSLSYENDDSFRDFCNLFTYYLCTECCKEIVNHPKRADWRYGHHHGLLLRQLLKHKEKDPFEGLMSAYGVYLEAEDKTFLEEAFARAFTNGHSNFDRSSSLFQAARICYAHSSETFISHGIEELNTFSGDPSANFPPQGSMHLISISRNRRSYAIDTDRLPFIYCATSHRGHHNPWVYCRGLIPKSRFQELGGKILFAPDREHFYAESSIPIKHWCFVYSRKARTKERLKFDIEEMREKISLLRQNRIPVIEFDTLQAFLRTLSLLQQKFEIQELMQE